MRIALTSRLHPLRRFQWTSAAALRMTLLLFGALSIPVLAAPAPDGGAAATSPAQTEAEPSLGKFLDIAGHLQLPAGFSGSVNPAGYRIVSGEGEALRFAPEEVMGGSSGTGWTGFGGIANGCNGEVFELAIGSAGEVYVGGEFTLCGDVPARNIARFDKNTQGWSSLGNGAANGVNSPVHALTVAGNMVYVGGGFTLAGDTPVSGMARFDSNTQTWARFGGSGVGGGIQVIAISGSAVYVGGSFIQAGGTPARNVARFDTVSQTWTSLGTGAANGVSDQVNALAVSGNSVYVGGGFTLAGGVPANRVARFDIIEQTWSGLGGGTTNGLNGFATDFAISGSALYVAGDFTQAGGISANRVARFETTTQTWSNLGSGVNGLALIIALSGSTVYVGGYFTQAGGVPANLVAGFDIASQTWAGFGSGAANGMNNYVSALAISESTVYVGGDFTQAGGAPANRVARFDMITQTWASLGPGVANGLNGPVLALSVSGNTVYVGGEFTRAAGMPVNFVARFDTSTQTWSSLGSGAANGVNDFVNALVISGNTVYVGGRFTQAGSVPASFVARFDITTQSWSSLGSGAANGVSGFVDALAVSGSGLYVGGLFIQAGAVPVRNIARFDTINQTWATLGSGATNGVSNSVHALAVTGTMVYVGGQFSDAGGAPANFVARFDTNTQTWSTLGSGSSNGVNDRVFALTVSGNMVYVGGFFTQAGDTPANRVARFDATTQTWGSLGSGTTNGLSSVPYALAVSGNTLYAGGYFLEAGGAPANQVARFDMNTQVWSSLGSGAANGVNGPVFALATNAQDAVYVGGDFTRAGGQVSSYIARYSADVILSNGFEPVTPR
jgi:hypothetical protein